MDVSEVMGVARLIIHLIFGFSKKSTVQLLEPPQWLSGWWYTYPSEKYIRSSVGMNIPNNQYMESYEIHVPNHQPVMELPKPVSPWHHLLLLRFRRLLLRPQFLHHQQQLRKTFAVRRQQGTLRSSGNEKRVKFGKKNMDWMVVDLPLWKIWVRQWGWWLSQYMENHKKMFQTTNQHGLEFPENGTGESINGKLL